MPCRARLRRAVARAEGSGGGCLGPAGKGGARRSGSPVATDREDESPGRRGAAAAGKHSGGGGQARGSDRSPHRSRPPASAFGGGAQRARRSAQQFGRYQRGAPGVREGGRARPEPCRGARKPGIDSGARRASPPQPRSISIAPSNFWGGIRMPLSRSTCAPRSTRSTRKSRRPRPS